jgi:arylsulfatase A-like enzyme
MATKKPNIRVIWGDDIGQFNISAYNSGMMGYKTPNIDSIASDGAQFTDWYGQQSCTAGRAAFITAQNPVRTGLTKVGLPGSMKEDPTIAELLKPMGYATGQFGKNHFGDKDEFLPTMHGFDEFFVKLRMPKVFNLRRDPFERADDNSNTYWDWLQNQAFVAFPPPQAPGSFNLDGVMKHLQDAGGGAHH